mgnify:CR=1 FL=1
MYKVNNEKYVDKIIKEKFPNWKRNKYYKKQSLKYKIVCSLISKEHFVLLKVILNYNNREIIYSKEFVERLIEILKDSYVDDETKNVVMQYIRLWDTSLADRRDILNMLQTVLEERNTEYRTEHYFKKRQEFGKMVLLVMMPVVLMLWLIIDFGATVKMLVCSAIFCGIVFQIFKFCKKKYSKMFSYMVSSLAGFGTSAFIFFAICKKEND